MLLFRYQKCYVSMAGTECCPMPECWLQMIREAVQKHTGVEPPEMLPEPVGKAYGKVEFQLAAPLIATLPYVPGLGDGIPTKHPEPMEHYDIG